MNNEKTYQTKSFEETRILGQKFARQLILGDVLAFYGDLGSGKTTFIQGLALGLNIKRRIISPTFIIVRHYSLKKGNFYHIDLYRTQNVDDLFSVGLDEVVINKENIVTIEWAEKLGKLLPQKRYDLKFSYLDDNTREIKIRKYE
jgi:tRNA threonylcarbamoyladenosine biosynthesis protein TsaE